MARRGRKPTGAQLVERLDGSAHAKNRLEAILETLSGQRTIPDACERLGIQETMFHKMRSQVLQTALSRLEPRPLGRPPQAISPEAQRIAELEDELARQQIKLRAAHVRQELAEKLPRIAAPASRPGKKTTRGVPRSRPRRVKRTARSPHLGNR
jgi:transposase-like protein